MALRLYYFNKNSMSATLQFLQQTARDFSQMYRKESASSHENERERNRKREREKRECTRETERKRKKERAT